MNKNKGERKKELQAVLCAVGRFFVPTEFIVCRRLQCVLFRQRPALALPSTNAFQESALWFLAKLV